MALLTFEMDNSVLRACPVHCTTFSSDTDTCPLEGETLIQDMSEYQPCRPESCVEMCTMFSCALCLGDVHCV